MPWHVTAFHPDYKMRDHRHTTPEDLAKVFDYGRQAGLKYIYAGNLRGLVGDGEDTRCHNCNATVIKRIGFRVMENRLSTDGKCPDCATQIPGIWGKPSGYGDGFVRRLV
jgi:pyruvate formate lyase activating enzyme